MFQITRWMAPKERHSELSSSPTHTHTCTHKHTWPTQTCTHINESILCLCGIQNERPNAITRPGVLAHTHLGYIVKGYFRKPNSNNHRKKYFLPYVLVKATHLKATGRDNSCRTFCSSEVPERTSQGPPHIQKHSVTEMYSQPLLESFRINLIAPL